MTRRTPKKHRSAATACDHERPLTGYNAPPDAGDDSYVKCHTHADCTDGGINGCCVGNGHDGYYCTYDLCFADTDCQPDAVCQCEGGFRSDHNVCVESSCRTDVDCGGSGQTGFCSPTFGSCGNYAGVSGYYCHTTEDECTDDEDCSNGDASSYAPYCRFEESVGHWKCSSVHCAG